MLNELYHPAWRAYANGKPLQVYPTNSFMRGVVVPAGVDAVKFVYEPFVWSADGLKIMGGAVILTILCGFGLRGLAHRYPGM